MRMIFVSWLDAQSDAEHWTTAADLEHTPRIIRTVGYDIGPQIDKHLSVAASWDSEADVYGSVTHIPDVCVRERYDLQLAVQIEGLD